MQTVDFNFFRNRQLVVQKTAADDQSRYGGYLYGAVQRDRLIVGGFSLGEFEPGERLIVRMAIGAQVVGFVSQVMESSEEYGCIYFLEYPSQVETLNLRRNNRINVFFPAELQSNRGSDDLHLMQAMVLNISRGGCYIANKTKLDPDLDIKLSFTLPGEKHHHQLEGTVMRTRKDDGVFKGAVRFAQSTPYVRVIGDVERWISMNLPFSVAPA